MLSPIRHIRTSLAAKLTIAFAAIALLPMLTAVWVIHRSETDSIIQQEKQHLTELAGGRQASLQDHIISLQETARAISDMDAVRNYLALRSKPDSDPQTIKLLGSQAENIIYSQQEALWGEVHHIFLTDNEGKVVLSPSHDHSYAAQFIKKGMNAEGHIIDPSGHYGSDISDSPYFKKALKSAQITDFFEFEERDHYHQLILQPVFSDDGNTVGVLVVEVCIDFVQDLMARDFLLGHTGRIYLATRKGKRITHFKADARDEISSPGLQKAIAEDTTVTGEFINELGNRVFGIYRPSTIFPWVVCIEVDSSEVYAPLRAQRRVLLLVVAFSSLTLVVLGALIGRMFGNPLRRSAEIVHRVAQGELDLSIPVNSEDEIGVFQSAAEAMRQNLLQQIETLDIKVAQRTSELESTNEKLLQELEEKEKLTQHLKLLSTAIEHNPAAVVIFNSDLIIEYVNNRFTEITGYTEEETLGKSVAEMKSGRMNPAKLKKMLTTIRSCRIWEDEFETKTRDGRTYWEHSSIAPVCDKEGKPVHFVAVKQDVTRRREMQKALTESQKRFALAVQGSRDGIWDWDLINNKVYYAPRFREMLGLKHETVGDSPDEWISRIVSDDLMKFNRQLNLHLDGKTEKLEVELRMRHEDGSTRWMLCRGAAVRNGEGRAERLVGSLTEITEIKEAQQQLKHAAEHDKLTGLVNRDVILRRIQKAIEEQKRDPRLKFAVLFFDFDRFKVVNDSLGHEVGDALLISIADRFRKHLREIDTAARFGGDEFIVLMPRLKNIYRIAAAADRLLRVFSEPHELAGHHVTSTASIGLVTSQMQYDRAEDVIRDADAAMYRAKISGKGRVVMFDKRMHKKAVDRLQIEEDLQFAIRRNQLRDVYQPIIDLNTGEIAGFEALLRWDHPKRGTISPVDFIPIAEDTGLIVPMGRWILREALQQAVDWNYKLGKDRNITIAVNLSKRQLLHPDIYSMIAEAMEDTGIDPALVKLEITESTIVDNRHDMIPTLNRIRKLGVKLAMDDFGTGYSSLSGLHKFPIDILKIDRSFITSMNESRDLAAVVHAIVTLAQNLGMAIVAEGIETAEQVAVLQVHGCDFGQGYLFDKPLDRAAARERLFDGYYSQKFAA